MKRKKLIGFCLAGILLGVFLLATMVTAQSLGYDVNKQLAEVRQATKKYQDYKVAEADGYVRDELCVPEMGVHFINFDLIDGELDPLKPEILVYEPKKNGGYQLVAVEYMTPGGERPSLFGQAFDDGPPAIPGSYALHAWVWKGNPHGIFEAHNPNVRACGQLPSH